MALSTIFKNTCGSARKQERVVERVENEHKMLEEYPETYTSGRATAQGLSSWHLSSRKHNTKDIVDKISFLCYQARQTVSAQDMLTDMLYLTNEDADPEDTPAAILYMSRVAFISRITEISRLGGAQFSGRCENPECSNTIDVPLADLSLIHI